MIRFEALAVSLEAIRDLSEPLTRVREQNPDLERQIRKALASVSLNLSEGRRRRGKDRTHLWRIAAGSADEARTGFLVAEAFGYATGPRVESGIARLDRVLAMIWRMTRE